MDNTAYDDEEEEVHSFADDEDLEVKFSIDEAEIQVPGPVETGANSRFLSSDLSASRSPRFSNPTMERQNSFKYRRSNRVAENYRAQEAPEVKVAMDPRQAHQSSYDEVETRVRSAPPAVSLKKSGSPSTPKYSPRSSNRTTPVPGPQQALHQTPKPTPQVTRASHHANDSPAANDARPEDSPGPVASPAPAPVASSASKKTTHHVPTRSPQPAPSRPTVTKRPIAEPSSANKRHSGIPTPQRPAFGSLAAKSPAPAVTPTPAVVVHKTVKPVSTVKQPTTELLSPIRARNFDEALRSSISRSSTPTSLHRPRYSIDNLAIHAPTTPTITGKEWNGSVRVKKPSANLEAQEHLDLLKRDSGEKALSRSVRRQPGSGEGGLTAQNLENNSAFSHSSYHTGTPSSLFSPVSQRKYGEDNTNGQRSVSSRSNTPSSLRPSSSRPSSRPNSRSTTPTNASAARRAPRDASLGQYFNTDEMTEISGYDSQAGDRLHRGNATSASGSLLSPYNLMVEGTHDRALDSASLSDADLQSVAKQMLLLRLMLQAKNAADAEKEEADILHAWQVVHSAEEQAQLMASQDSGIDEMSRTHQHILDMEKMVDELNDHLAPVFERLSAYRTLKEAQDATSYTGNDSDGSVTSPPADPLLDAYSERAQAHKELQTRLASLVKSIAALKKTVDCEGFVCPSEEALATRAAESEEDSPNATSGYRVTPAVNPVRVQAGTPVADRSRSTSPAPTRRLSLVERQTLNREAMVTKNAQQREAEAASVAPPAHTVVPARSKSPAATARGGTTVFSVPAAARPTAASIAGVVRPKSPAPATAAAARSKSPAPMARAKFPGPAGAGAAKRLNRPPAAGVSAVLESTVSDGKQPRSVPRAKKAEPTPEMSVAAAAEAVECVEDSRVGEAVLQENVARPELTTQEHTVAADEAIVTEEDVVSHHAASEEVAAAPAAASETNNSVEDQGTSENLPAVEDSASAATSAIPATAELAPIVWKDEEVDAQLNSMFVVPLASPNSVDGAKNAVLPTPPLSPMTPGPSNTDAFNPALISAAAGSASSAESTADVASEGASPSKKAAFERLMKRLNSNKEMNSANDSGNNSTRASPVVPTVPEVSEVLAVAASAAVNSTTAAAPGASASVSVTAEEPLTRRLSVAEMRAQFSGGGAKQPLAKQPLAPRPAAVPVIVAPVVAPAADPVVAAEVVPAMTPEIVDVVAPVMAPIATPDVVSTAPVKAAEGEAFNSNNKDLTLDIMSAEAVTVEFNDNSPTSQKDGESNSATSATTSPFKSGEVKVPVLAGLAGPTTPSGVSPMKRVQSTRVSELMNKFGGSRRDLTPASSPSPATASPAPAITRNPSMRGSIASISGIEVKRSVFEKGELNIADGDVAEITATKSPSNSSSLSKQRSKSPASLSRPGSSNNLSPVAGKSPSSTSNGMRAGSKSPARSPNVGSKSPAAAVAGSSNSNPASPANRPATSLKSVPSFTGGASSKSAAAAVFTFAEKEDEEQKAVKADTSAVVAESAAENVKESVPVPAPIATEMAPPSYEESSVDAASLADTYIALNNASASTPAVRVEASAATPLSGRSPRTPGTARTVTLASPEQLPMTTPFATSPSTVELLQAAASTESDGSMDWGVDGTYSHSLQVSRSEEFIRTANNNTNTSQLKMQTVTEEGAGENGVVDEKEEDLTATVVSAVSAKLTAHFQASKSSENVLAAMEAERDEDVQQVEAVASNGNGTGEEEEEECLVLDLNTIETSIKHSPKPHNAPTNTNHAKSAGPSTVDATQPMATSASTAAPAAAVTTTATVTVSDDSKANSPANGEGAYSRVQSGRFSAVDSDVSMSAPPTPLPLTSFTNVTSSVKAQNTPVVPAAAETPQSIEESAQEEEADGESDLVEGDFGADGNSETASLAGSTATNGSKKHRRPTLKGLWKRIGSVSSMSGSSKQKPGTEL